jgi:hypothetical protein
MVENLEIELKSPKSTYQAKVKRIELKLKKGQILTHWEPNWSRRPNDRLIAFGRELSKDVAIQKKRQGEISEARLNSYIAAIASDAGLPDKGRRITRTFSPIQTGKRDFQSPFEKVEKRAYRLKERFNRLYIKFRDGEIPNFSPCEWQADDFMRTILRLEVSRILRELNYPDLLTAEERRRKQEAFNTKHDPESTSSEKKKADDELKDINEKLDNRYSRYSDIREQIFSQRVSPEDVKKEIARLRKSKAHPEYKNIVRLLRTESLNLSFYQSYWHVMEAIKEKLIDRAELQDAPSRGFYKFMHSVSDLLDGIVPAAHPSYCLFRDSKAFRNALAKYSSEKLNNDPRGKLVETVCELYGSILAIIQAYSEEIHKVRTEEAQPTNKGKERHSATQRSGGEGSQKHKAFLEEAQNGKLHEESTPNLRQNAIETPVISESEFKEKFGDEMGTKVYVYLRKEGKVGHAQTTAKVLAEEYEVSERTIYRWVKDGKEKVKNLEGESGLKTQNGAKTRTAAR